MKKFERLTRCLLLLICFAPFGLPAQNETPAFFTRDNSVKITDENGKKVKFNIKGDIAFEIVNGTLNVAVMSDRNRLLQVTGISEQALRDTALKSRSFRAVFISSPSERSYKSNENNRNDILIIKCRSAEKGSPLQLILKTKLYCQNRYYLINAVLTGRIPEKKFTSEIKN